MSEPMKETAEQSRYLCFSLGSEEYAIPLLTVKEVIAMPEITPVPQTPAYFLGIMNLRGQVITILDLRQKLNIKPQGNSETSVVICDFEKFSVGVVVDSINSVLAPEENTIVPKPDLQNSKASAYVTGVYRKDKRLVLFLDIFKSLNIEDQSSIKKHAA